MDDAKLPLNITRVDLYRDGNNVNLTYYVDGWVQDVTPPSQWGYAVDTRIESLLRQYEIQLPRFAVWMADGFTGRALRGKITRVDFLTVENQMHIKKYPYGWTAKTPALSDELKTPQECEEAIKWCQSNGWVVRRWPGGGRAWRGPLLPVRDAGAIVAMRRNIQYFRSQGIPDERNHFNLAFDF